MAWSIMRNNSFVDLSEHEFMLLSILVIKKKEFIFF